jgi:HD-like signal output (HDOD) protein
MKSEKRVNPAILQGLAPLNAMSPKALENLGSTLYFETQMAEEKLINAAESDPAVYYLLSGEIILAFQNGETRAMAGGSQEARTPLVPGSPEPFDAISKSSIIFFRVPLAVIQDYLPKDVQDIAVPVESDADIMSSIGEEIDGALKANKLIVPSLPEVAEKVREAVQNPATDVVDVAKIIQADPPLAARILQVANSPVYRGNVAITNCRTAVSRLGMKVTRDLVMSCSLQQLFKSEHQSLQKELKEQWRQSTFVGAISFIVARLAPHLDVDRALLAGLLHNIGALPLIAYAPSYPALTTNHELLQKTIERLGPKVGEQVLRRWRFDNDLIVAVAEAKNWSRDSGAKADICDVVQLAQLYSYIDTPAMAVHPTLDQIPAFSKVPLGRLGPKMTVRILDEARAEIADMQKILGAS